MKKFVYADNAATTKLDPDVFEIMKNYLLEDYGNPSQLYSFSKSTKKALKEARTIIANCINANPDEIYFTSGGTESDNWAIKGTLPFFEDKALITSTFEHHAVLNSVKSLCQFGIDVRWIKPTSKGIITPENLCNLIDDKIGLVSIMFVNNEIGTIQPIKELAEIAHKNGAIFHTDAVQAIGHMKIDVKDLGVDLLSASAHKFNGPKGVGFLYIKSGTKINSYLDGGSQEFKLRAGTENVSSIIGMAHALKKNLDKIDDNTKRIKMLENRLLDNLDTYENIEYVRNGRDNTLPGIISLSFFNQDGEALLHRLDLKGICVSTGSACDSMNTNISHVLKSINLSEKYAMGTIRISLSKDNTIDEIDYISESIHNIITR